MKDEYAGGQSLVAQALESLSIRVIPMIRTDEILEALPPIGTCKVFFDEMTFSLDECGLDLRVAAEIAAQKARASGSDFPCAACFVKLKAEVQHKRWIIQTYRYRFNPNSKDFYLMIAVEIGNPAGFSGKVIWHFEGHKSAERQIKRIIASVLKDAVVPLP